MFVNGVLETSTSWTGQLQLNDVVSISGFEARYIAGDLDEFRLSSSARYVATFTPPTSLVSDASTQVLWLFDEGSGSTSADMSGHGRAASLGVGPGAGGPPAWVVTDR